MPWKAGSVMEERPRFVARLLDGQAVTDVCREFGISRKIARHIGPWRRDCILNFFLSVVCAGSVLAGAAGAALADYRTRNDYGGFI